MKGDVSMNIKAILQTIAKQNHTTVGKIRKEIEKAILDAKDTPNFKKTFGTIIPTLEEFIEKGSNLVTAKKGCN
jgi:hypothetical protein